MNMKEGYSSVDRWLSSVGEKTAQGYLWHFEAFMGWVKENSAKFEDYTPDELIEYVKMGNGPQLDEILDLKKDYLLTMEGRASHKRNANKSIKSFFAHNRRSLPRDTTLNIRGDRPKVKGELTPENVRDVILSSNLMYKAVFTSMIMSGMGQAEVVHWSDNGLPKLEEDLNDERVEVIKVDLPGRKAMRNEYSYYTFVGPEAVQLLRRYLKSRPRRVGFAVKRTGKTPRAIFLNQYGKGLTQNALYRYWTRKLIRLGLIQPEQDGERGKRYGRNPHELRDTFRTLYRRSQSPTEYAEYFMGHAAAFDKYGYDKTALNERQCLNEYRKAVPYLSILSGNKPYGVVDEDTIEQLRRENEELKRQIGESEGSVDKLISVVKDLAQRIEKLEKKEFNV